MKAAEDIHGNEKDEGTKLTRVSTYLSQVQRQGAFKCEVHNGAEVITRIPGRRRKEMWKRVNEGWTHIAFLESSLSGRPSGSGRNPALATKYPKKNTFPSPNR